MHFHNAKWYMTILLAWYLAQATLFTAAGPGSSGRIPLSTEVEVGSKTLALSDLLPPAVPAEFRQAASGVLLGNAPQPGAVRVLMGDEIRTRLGGDPGMLARLFVPDRIIVSRSHRSLTRQEIRKAIDAASGCDGILDRMSGAESINLENLRLFAPVEVTQDDPGLRLVRVEFDPLRSETRFCLRASNEPGILPFYVTVAGGTRFPATVARRDLAPGEFAGPNDLKESPLNLTQTGDDHSPLTPEFLAGRAVRLPIRAGQLVTPSMFSPVVLVRQGKTALLLMESGAFRISMPVTPLESGMMGQAIRVRNLDSQRILVAEVAGPGRLRKILPNRGDR